MSRNLVAVIVTFNRLEKLSYTLESALINRFYRVIVVNNCSTDGTADYLNNLLDERLVVIHSQSNLGGAGGFNLGFAHAANALPEADWLVCFDDDAWPEADVVGEFEGLDIPNDVGSLAAAVYLPDGERISEMNRPSLNPFWHLREFCGAAGRGRDGFHVPHSAYNTEQTLEVDASSFVGCFVRLSLIREKSIGLPRSELFIYADDIIYLLELRKAGYKHLFVPQLRFRHDCETLINQKDVYHPLWKVYFTYRNRLETYRIASGFFYPAILLIKVPAFFMTVRFYEKFERKRFLGITARAVWDGIRRDYRKSLPEVIAFSQVER